MSPREPGVPDDNAVSDDWSATGVNNAGGQRATTGPRWPSPWVMAALGVALLLAVGFAAPMLWSGPGFSDRAQKSQFESRFSTGLTRFSRGDPRAAPDIAGETLSGDHLALTNLRGHVVVVNVWGSWCVPCRDEAPDLRRVARETRSQGVRFVGIDTRDNRGSARAFVRNFDVPYPSLYDLDGRLLMAFSGIIPISAVPSTVVIDPNGLVAARVVGRVDYTTLRGLIHDTLARQRPRRSQAAP